ncbi:MAG TPA: hypothetical protein VG389_15770 [Myxococcota bacterium]|jgi:hypothetical protein|nr:hypothetical protein [Myxococcota bacterium]
MSRVPTPAPYGATASRSSAAALAALAAAVLGAGLWMVRPLLPRGGGVGLPDLDEGSARAVLPLSDLVGALGGEARSVSAGAGALAAGSVALLAAEAGVAAPAALAAGAATALLPGSGHPLGALMLGVWLACARLRRRPARWRAALAGCALAAVGLLDAAALLLLPVALLHVRDAYPRGLRVVPVALVGGFALGGFSALAALGLLLRDIGGVAVRLRRLAELNAGGAPARAAEALWPPGPFGALAEGRLGVGQALALCGVAATLACLGAGLLALVRRRHVLWPPRRGPLSAAVALLVLLGAAAALRPSNATLSWTPALGGLAWLWAVGAGGLWTARARWLVVAGLPCALAAAQLAPLWVR